jgi:hypothetical protein
VVEGTRLLIWRTGNGTEGSNPSLSATPMASCLCLRLIIYSKQHLEPVIGQIYMKWSKS